MKNSQTVDDFINQHDQWRQELTELRSIIRDTELQEMIKWGMPVYTLSGKNVIGLGAFKSYVGIWFYQGALLKDSKKKLINAQQEKTKALLQWRFRSREEITAESATIREYIEEAISNQKQGRSVLPEMHKRFFIPEELESLLLKNSELKEKFYALSDSKQREYAEYITQARRMETKLKRLEKISPLILQGIGLNDIYK